ncbi:purine nucleoside phosphorylase [Stylonychia lemnae]|uniref:purine-nucleoside phosphorylase n=1 Tax=Stylonychia lemnae TaxID=5949 RepID=A0A078AVX7_STYLE|nr:purine nucleoside phosphorylase [Stylonychia lemnae]|eukprot:CDW84928.1 purine nucleoside phosphorylase [Stylonychia lemnae]
METIIPQNNHSDPFLTSQDKLGVEKIDLSIVEGSGLLDISHHLIPDPIVIQMTDVPHCPIPTAIGHKQQIFYGIVNGRRTIIWNGRIHYYEGYRVCHQAFPAYLSAYLGCGVFITTNAAGFINQNMAIGDLALITDHIISYLDNLLRHNKDISSDIFSSSQIYDQEMINLTREAFTEAGLKLTEGHYCYFALPNYESPSEIQIMHDLGAATVGASTLPEQIACYLTGMRRVIISSATSPSSGMSSQEISGEEVLDCGVKCDEMFMNKPTNALMNQFSKLSTLNNQRIEYTNLKDVAMKIANKVKEKLQDVIFERAIWLMSDQLYNQFIEEHREQSENPIYILNLSDIHPFRTRSYQEAQLVFGKFNTKYWIIIRQSHLEGMLPIEYSAILQALKMLNLSQAIEVYFEASSVSNESLNDQVHRISNSSYLNKRFYKLTEDEGYDTLPEPTLDSNSTLSLIAFEGTMLPSKTELKFAQKAGIDLYTTTNFSFADQAQHLGVNVRLNAVAKRDLSRGKDIKVNCFNEDSKYDDTDTTQKQSETIRLPEVKLDYDAIFNIKHSRDEVFETSVKVGEILGQVDNILVLEKETYEVFMNDLSENFTLDKKIRFNLLDYHTEESVDVLKITTKNGVSIIVLSQTLTYQSNVPFQTSLLPMRLIIMGCKAKNFLTCPHVWGLKHTEDTTAQNLGSLFIVKDHANISAQPPGIGPNLDEFYDISTMYEKGFVQSILNISNSNSLEHAYGEVFWANNSAIPSTRIFENLGRGVSNQRITFKGLIKSGVNELMAVHHRRNYSEYKLTSAMVGLVTDSYIRRQSQTETYRKGVSNLIKVVFQSFETLKIQ